MIANRIVRIARMSLNPNQRKSFRFDLGNQFKAIKAVLYLENISLNLSLDNERRLSIENLSHRKSTRMPAPNNRILKWDELLAKNQVITGSIQNHHNQSRTINIYLILQPYDHY